MSRPRKKVRREYGSGSISRRNDSYVAQWMADGKRRTRSFQTETAAVEFLAGEKSAEMSASVDRLTPNNIQYLAEKWLDSRSHHKSAYTDQLRWQNHWQDLIGCLRPNDLTVPVLKQALVALRAKNLSNKSLSLCTSLLSSLYGDLVEEGLSSFNPVHMLSKKTRNEYLKSEHDPKDVPFIKDPADVLRIYQALFFKNRSVAVAYAVGALAGLRTGEVRALTWDCVDFSRQTITVSKQVQERRGVLPSLLTEDGTTTVKDGEVRIVPLLDALAPILLRQKMETGVGLVAPSATGTFLNKHDMGRILRDTLSELSIYPELATYPMCWYASTRHGFASQWIMSGGSKEKLQEILGHSSIVTTERYGHLMPGNFSDEDRSRIKLTA